MLNKIWAVSVVILVACGGDPGYNPGDDGGINQNVNNSEGVCGDGVLDPGEACDDGAENSDTRPGACRTDCRLATCGDGVIDEGEQCDQGDLGGSSCQARGFTKGILSCNMDTCQFDDSGCSTCGDGVAELSDPDAPGYETCDGTDLRGQDCISVGQAQGELACNPLTCKWDVSGCVGTEAVCGNGVVEGNEGCDDGNGDNTDACPDGVNGTCQPAQCGDGFVQAGVEGCDDGNNFNEDDCPDGVGGTCEWAECGDGFVHAVDEVCEPSLDPTCNISCQNYCGDGWINGDEDCDDGTDNGTYGHCMTDCTGIGPHCGDGTVNGPEDCELSDPLCGADCTYPVCGDGVCECGPESPALCPADCGTGGTVVGCTAGSFGQPPQCCTGLQSLGECIIYDHPYDSGIRNCGSCGNHCSLTEFCYLGQCTSN